MKLDHIVYFTKKSPAQVVAEQKGLGHHVVMGGSHPQWGTCNALRYVGNSYIEYLSIEHRQIAENSDQFLARLLIHRLKHGDDWGTICISVDNIVDLASDLKRRGFNNSGVIDGKRKTPDGSMLSWKLLFIDQENLDQLPFPFFIQWNESEDVRFNRLRQKGLMKKEDENLNVKRCIFRTSNPVRDMAHWAHLLSQKAAYPPELRLNDIGLKFIQAEGGEAQCLHEVKIG